MAAVVPTINDYLDLVRRHPLRAIRNDHDHAAAGLVLNRLLGRVKPPLSEGEHQYLDALIELTKAYESQAPQLKFEKMSPLEIVRYLMTENSLNTERLGKILGSQTAASLFLNGKRPLSKAQMFRLAERFKVDAALFLERPYVKALLHYL